ncbi:helix-turn-helix transcriptional regulator [uncultured Veillonella sp.]|uniref:helix-turn-helix domain-containing protein n=1 Tax=uncultured Veillonella sp. TaxID=159268 RepID=UPI0025E1C816|nr:helix-turn-helix transcriptional regulator [uncultured Veillonella sp.]
MPPENIQTIFDNKLKDPQYKESYLKEKTMLASAVTITKSREASGLSQRELAERSGVPQSIIARIERGYNISIDTLSKIAFALNKRVKISFI